MSLGALPDGLVLTSCRELGSSLVSWWVGPWYLTEKFILVAACDGQQWAHMGII